LKEALIRKYGEDWFADLEEVAEVWLQEHKAAKG
jgi:hypothetical protein